MNARPEPFAIDGVSPEESQVMYAASLDALIITEEGALMVPEGTNYIRFP